MKPRLAAKRRTLDDSGTLNPRAEAVRDAAFKEGQGGGFFDPHDLVQVRYEMLRRVRTEGRSVTQAVADFGFTRPTFYKVQDDFERAGLVGLLPAKRGPHGPHKITQKVQRFIEEQRLADPALDGPALAAGIEQRFGLAVHRRTVERALARSKKKPR
jgi:transposase